MYMLIKFNFSLNEYGSIDQLKNLPCIGKNIVIAHEYENKIKWEKHLDSLNNSEALKIQYDKYKNLEILMKTENFPMVVVDTSDSRIKDALQEEGFKSLEELSRN